MTTAIQLQIEEVQRAAIINRFHAHVAVYGSIAATLRAWDCDSYEEIFKLAPFVDYRIFKRDGGRMTAIIESPGGKRFRVWPDGQIDRA